MRVSVVIPAFNEQHHVGACVDAAWRAGADEVMVADGGSRDATADEARRRGAAVIDAPRGRARQQNTAACRASGDVLWFVHADCRLTPAAGEQLRRALVSPAAQAGAFRQRIAAAGWIYRWIEAGNALRAGWGCPYGDQAPFLRRALFERLGGFPDEPLMEDLILSRQVARHTRWLLLPGPIEVSARRWQRHGVVRQTLRNWTLVALWRLGLPPQRLAHWYPPHAPAVDPREPNSHQPPSTA